MLFTSFRVLFGLVWWLMDPFRHRKVVRGLNRWQLLNFFSKQSTCVYLFHCVIATEFEFTTGSDVLHAVDSLNVKLNMNYDRKE